MFRISFNPNNDPEVLILFISLSIIVPISLTLLYIKLIFKLFPSTKFYYSDSTSSTKYNPNKILHRDKKPSVVIRSKDRHTLAESYYKHGICHRTDGPAIIYYCGTKDNIETKKRYMIEGEELDEQTFNAITKAAATDLAIYLVDPRSSVRHYANTKLKQLSKGQQDV